ncbi:MAG: ABC transporter permease [Bacteroidales bacterium]
MINKNSLIGTIRQGFLDAAYVWKQEMKMIFKDAGVMIFLFILPLGYPVIYGLIYNPEVPRDIPIIVVDEARTPLSREYCRMLDATSQTKVAGYAANMTEAKAVTAEQGAFGILHFDRNFEKNIYRGIQSHVTLYSNMNSLLYYRSLLSANTDVMAAFNTQIQEKGLVGATVKQQSMALNPIKNTAISLFNPASGFATFVMPAVEVLVIQQSLLLAIGMLAGSMRERNRNRELVPLNFHYFGTFRIVLGKAMCFLAISILTSFWTMSVVPQLFSYPRLGNIMEIELFMLPFILASIFMGMTFSCLIRGRELPMLFFVFMSIPLLFMSGISWPWASIPTAWKWVGSLIPSTYAIQGFVQMNSCGASLHDVKFYYLFEWGLVLLYFFTACVVYRMELRKSMRMLGKPHDKNIQVDPEVIE